MGEAENVPRGIPPAKWLDPRVEPNPPIASSVNIPIDQLPSRVHELPSKTVTILVADAGEEARAACDWLRQNGRDVELGSSFEYGDPGVRRLWSPTAYLEHCLTQIQAGTVLDLACGAGRDAVYLASCGFRVTGMDRLEDALELGRGMVTRYLSSGALPVAWLRLDLEREIPSGSFDLVTCFRYLNRPLLQAVGTLLVPGGNLIVETFTTQHRERFGKPRSDDHVLKPGELRSLVSTLEIVAYSEDWHDDRHTARLLARKS